MRASDRSVIVVVSCTAILCVPLAALALERSEAGGRPHARPGGAPVMEPALRAAFVRAVEATADEGFDLVPLGGGRWRAGAGGVEHELSAEGGLAFAGPGGAGGALRLASWGRATGALRLEAPTVEVAGNEARFEHGAALVERWVHGPLGMEQLVDVSTRLPGEGPLVFRLALLDVDAVLENEDTARLVDPGGRVVARYGELWVEDARGTPVPAWLESDGDTLCIVVDDRAAQYPLHVDPLVAVREARLAAFDGALADYFGVSVALSGDTALVGAYWDDTFSRGMNAGSAYVFVRTGTSWALEAKLETVGNAINYEFGGAVALDGDTALVGAIGAEASFVRGAGLAYVFQRSGGVWTQEATLDRSDRASGEEYASSVALDGGTAIVGAWDDDSRGSAYVFVRSGTTWTEQARLVAGDARLGDAFGYSVAVRGDTALVGAYQDDVLGVTDNGSVHVFTRSGTTWTFEAQLSSSTRSMANFGECVALEPDLALIGAPGDESARSFGTGAAYVYARTGGVWAQEAKLEAADGFATDRFGDAVALSGATAVVGASFGDGAAGGVHIDAGTAYVFSRLPGGTWRFELELEDTIDGRSGDLFGDAVAIDGARVLVGSQWDDSLGAIMSAGSAYVFNLVDPLACTVAADCTSGFCVDGVCCATACGGGAADCQACSVAAGGTTDGACTPLRAAIASGVRCRDAADVCDVPEACSASSTSCPPDGVAGAGTACRGAADACDAAEVCTGASAACPADRPAVAGRECRASTDTSCDPAEVCDGTSTSCPPDTSGCGSLDAGASDGGVVVDGGGAIDGGGAVDGGVMPDASAGADTGTVPLDAGVPVDATTGLDASARDAPASDARLAGDTGTPPSTATCGCRAARAEPRSFVVLALCVLFTTLRRRSRAGFRAGSR